MRGVKREAEAGRVPAARRPRVGPPAYSVGGT